MPYLPLRGSNRIPARAFAWLSLPPRAFPSITGACLTSLLIGGSPAIGLANEVRIHGAARTVPSSEVTSHDFVVRSFPRGPDAAEVLKQCTELRTAIHIQWLGPIDEKPWLPSCEITLHPSRSSYLRAVGQAGGQTSGSSLIQHRSGRIIRRSVDLLVDAQGNTTALPHELTHVVLADFFNGALPPLWVDEGIAMLADTDEKQGRHQQDCARALRTGNKFQLSDLMTRERLSSAEFAAFYGQSHSLVQFFAGRDEPAKLLPFVRFAKTYGYDKALREFYAIDNVGELERNWHRFVTQSEIRRP